MKNPTGKIKRQESHFKLKQKPTSNVKPWFKNQISTCTSNLASREKWMWKSIATKRYFRSLLAFKSRMSTNMRWNSSLLHTRNTWICEWPKDTKLVWPRPVDFISIICRAWILNLENSIAQANVNNWVWTSNFKCLIITKNDNHHSKSHIPRNILKRNLDNNRSSKNQNSNI